MATYRIATKFHNVTGLNEDAFISNFFFATSQAAHTADVGVELARHVESAYSAAAVPMPGGRALMTCLGPQVSRVTRPESSAYNWVGGSPLAPPVVWAALAASESGIGHPSQVACVLSYRGPYGDLLEEAPDDADTDSAPERPRSRVRGRSFFGPLDRNTVSIVNGQPVPNDQLVSGLLDLAARLEDVTRPALTAVNTVWVVASQRSGSPRSQTPVTQAWVDRRFDTQRRRLSKAASRDIAVLVP